MIRTPMFVCLLLAPLACGQASKDHDSAAPAPETAPAAAPAEPAPATAEASVAVMRVPLGADGQPDLNQAVLRTGIDAGALSEDDAQNSAAFETLGQSTETKVTEELDRDSSSQAWFLLPWRNNLYNGYGVRSGPYLLPWRRAVANGYPVRSGGYILPFRQYTANAQSYYYYNNNCCY